MLKCDGFSPRERLLMNLKGLPWFFGKNGTLTAMKSQYMDWFKKIFIQASILSFVNILFGLKHSKDK
jgi:predicted metal-dependent hydrolase